MSGRDKTRKRRVALVLQGGGALGAYQAGVYEALHRHHVVPDWVVGTSIGAINAALIAGNPPQARVARLREFWRGVACDDALDLRNAPDALRRYSTWLTTLGTVAQGVPGFFAPRVPGAFAAGLSVPPQAASFYDTDALAATLERLVDFKHLASPEAMRLTVAAVQVTTGKLVSFDSAHQSLSAQHVMASGALPPGFPPVRIDAELYWDGGLYSNTPLELVLEDEPRCDTLCFMVELWRGDGPEPRSLGEVQTRQKDIVFASRSTRHIEAYRRLHDLRHAVRALYAALPAERRDAPALRKFGAVGCGTTMHIVRLIYPGHDWKMASKDVNFSRGSLEWRWQQGLRDAERVLAQAPWLAPVAPDAGVVVHEPTAEQSRGPNDS